MDNQKLEALERRIQQIEDLEAIKRLKYEYAGACDDFYNPEIMLTLFTEDAIWDGGADFGVHRGHAELKEFFMGVSPYTTFCSRRSISTKAAPRLRGNGICGRLVHSKAIPVYGSPVSNMTNTARSAMSGS